MLFYLNRQHFTILSLILHVFDCSTAMQYAGLPIRSHSCPPKKHTVRFTESFIPESPGWGPGRGHSHSARWSWDPGSAGRSTGTQCVSLWSQSPLVEGHVYLQQTFDMPFVNNWLCSHSVCVNVCSMLHGRAEKRYKNNTNLLLHWCWSATWPLTSVCWLLWHAAMSCSLCQPASWSPPSPQGTDLAHLATGRQDSVKAVVFFRFYLCASV